MSISAATLGLLMEAGVTGDALLVIVRSIESDHAKKPSKGAERQARYRSRQRDVTSDVTGDAAPLDKAPPVSPTPPSTPQNSTPVPPLKAPPTPKPKGKHPLPADWAPDAELVAYAAVR